jgi:hypothetical protein
MATEPVARPQGWPERDAKGYERSDVRAKWIGGVVAFLIIGAVALHFILRLQLHVLAKRPPAKDIWSTAVRGTRPEIPTNTPRLQISAPADLAEFRSREDTELNTYGWINKTQGIVRIPIQQAMNMLVEKKLLPVREGTNAAPSGPSPLQLQQERPLNAEGGKSD